MIRTLAVRTTLAATLAVAALPVVGQETTSTTAPVVVVVVVEVPKPWYAPRFVVVRRMRETIPRYETLPGLAYKAFSIARSDQRYGGIYLWTDAASARAWFGPDWFARVEKERGPGATVRWFEAPVVLDNAPAANDGRSVSTIVTIPTPAGIGRERLVAEFEAALPTYRKVDGLLRKYFIITADGRFGGVYLWRDQDAADRWFDTAWHERVRKTYGVDARLEWFDVPILMPTKLAGNADSAPPR